MLTRPLLVFILIVSGSICVFAQRIITAGSSSTEIVCVLGHCDHIVATDLTSKYPEQVQSLPSIGYRTGISAEGIISLKPDLVIFEEKYVKEEIIAQIKSTGIKTLVVDHEQNFESTQRRIRAIAAALNRNQEGEKLIQQIAADFAALEKKVNAAPGRPKVLCVYARGTGNMQVAGKNTSFGLLSLAGVENAVAEMDGYKPLNAESLIQANPDYILFFTTGLESIGGIDGVLAITGVAQTNAGKKRQIISMEGTFLTNWGPRVAAAAEQLFYLTHPEAIK
jgi:iron complex transport system substrate-binding protein